MWEHVIGSSRVVGRHVSAYVLQFGVTVMKWKVLSNELTNTTGVTMAIMNLHLYSVIHLESSSTYAY